MPLIFDDLTNKVYKNFIFSAVKKSDIFMFVLRKDIVSIVDIRPNIAFDDSMDRCLNKWNITRDDVVKTWGNHQLKHENEKTIFYEKCMSFVDEFNKYHIETKNNAIWPSSISYGRNTNLIDICFYKIDNNIVDLLMKPKNLFSWKYPFYPEDIAFFENRTCWFYLTSHDRQATFNIRNNSEIEYWESLGIKFFNKDIECENIFKI